MIARATFGGFLQSDLMPAGVQASAGIWAAAFLVAPAMLPLAQDLVTYNFIRHFRTQLVERALWSDEALFLLLSCGALGIVSVVMWDTLFPNRRDVFVLGPLPRRDARAVGRTSVRTPDAVRAVRRRSQRASRHPSFLSCRPNAPWTSRAPGRACDHGARSRLVRVLWSDDAAGPVDCGDEPSCSRAARADDPDGRGRHVVARTPFLRTVAASDGVGAREWRPGGSAPALVSARVVRRSLRNDPRHVAADHALARDPRPPGGHRPVPRHGRPVCARLPPAVRPGNRISGPRHIVRAGNHWPLP